MAQATSSAHQAIIQKLRTKVPFFANFATNEMEALLQLSSRREYKDSDIIFLEDAQGSEMFVILSGLVKISKKGESDSRIHLAELTVGDCFGEMSVIDGSNRSAQASAEGEVILLTLHEEVLKHDLNLAYKLFKNFSVVMANRLRVTNKNFAEMTSDESKNRVKLNDILKKYSEKGGSFENSNFRDSLLNNVLFSKGSMGNALFVGSRLSECRLNNNNFDQASFVGADINNSEFVECSFSKVNFSASLFEKVVFRNCQFDAATINQLETIGVKIVNDGPAKAN